MNTVEDRLSAALHARADLVQQADLRSPAMPEAEPQHRLRPWRYAALAAACVAAIAVPIVASELRGPHDEVTPGGDQGLDWPLSEDRVEHDVDGDGAPDQLTLRVRERDGPGPARLDIALSAGGVVYRVFEEEALNWGLDSRADLDGDGDHEIVVSRDGPVVVLDLRKGSLVALSETDDASLSSGVDAGGHLTDVWVSEHTHLWSDEHFVLNSSRSLETFDEDEAPPGSYQVEVWSWSMQGDELVALRQPGPWCREAQPGGPQYPVPCAGIVPSIMREVTETVGVGETIALADPIPTLSLIRAVDTIVLAYSLSGRQMTGTLPDIPGDPRAYASIVVLGSEMGFLVRWGDGETVPMDVFVVRGDRLELLPVVADIPPPGTVEQAERSFHMFLTEDGTLYTREPVGPTDSHYQLWRWVSGQGNLAVEDLGIWCLDYEKTSATRC